MTEHKGTNMIKVTTSNVQAVQDEIRRALEEFATGKFVTVGIHEGAGNHEDDDITNAQLGAILHFGTSTIPARPWLDVGVATGDAEYLKIITNAIDKGENLERALNQIGVVAVAKTQQYMTELKTPPNAASTIAKKGSANPLIDTGALRQSITYSIDTVKPNEGVG
jgi:hypothetical protein